MLYWIWFAFFVFLGAMISYINGVSDGEEQPEPEAGIRGFLAIAALVAATFVSWPVLWEPIFKWLAVSLPQAETEINSMTVVALMIVLFLVFIVGIATLFELIGSKHGSLKKNNQETR